MASEAQEVKESEDAAADEDDEVKEESKEDEREVEKGVKERGKCEAERKEVGDKAREEEGNMEEEGGKEEELEGKEGDVVNVEEAEEEGNVKEEGGKEAKKEEEREADEVKGEAAEGGGGSKKGKMDLETGSKKEEERALEDKKEKSERPTRERKTVDRYWMPSPVSKSPAGKPLAIVKGSGTPLKDIPNVAFKLSKRKPDDNLQLLHAILFGKKAKAHNLKRDIGKFSGFVWIANEEKQRAKVKEKLDKCVKEKLIDFCDMLNIPINKAIVKKEDLSVKLLEFLECPRATTDVLLADQEQRGKRRKSMETLGKNTNSKAASAEKSTKNTQVGEKRKRTSKVEDENETNHKDVHSVGKDDSAEEGGSQKAPKEGSEQVEINSVEEDEPKEQMTSPKDSSKEESSQAKRAKRSTNKNKNNLEKSAKRSVKSTNSEIGTSRLAAPESSASWSQEKGSSRTKHKVEKEMQKDKLHKLEKETPKVKPTQVNKRGTSKKQSVTPTKPSKDKGKVKEGKKAKAQPSKEELHDVIADILKEVDFNTATLSDILRQLGAHFGLDLMDRKAEVKEIITEVINSMSDEEDDDDEEDEGNDDEAGHEEHKNNRRGGGDDS
ncbi:hypothetical protein Nepgr_025299 [Nepenthes gracilis]|uniref:DEK-C domain-containing protein n=1 Tax=Nepenthes gracilis TaxID=150966 RepID=A0AAD3T6E9_NEPGR|nr:hypothetical protein Nepgr_025299 [Nepenthes gracilis]